MLPADRSQRLLAVHSASSSAHWTPSRCEVRRCTPSRWPSAQPESALTGASASGSACTLVGGCLAAGEHLQRIHAHLGVVHLHPTAHTTAFRPTWSSRFSKSTPCYLNICTSMRSWDGAHHRALFTQTCVKPITHTGTNVCGGVPHARTSCEQRLHGWPCSQCTRLNMGRWGWKP